MISIKKNFLFIHIPKTGGNSIQKVLIKHSEDEMVLTAEHHDGENRFEIFNRQFNTRKHSTLKEYKKVVPPAIYHKLFKFATIRNPWDLMVSFYFSPHRNVQKWDRNDFIKLLNSVETFQHYIGAENKFSFCNWKVKRSIYNLDFILRFECLNEDFQKVCSRLDIPFESLPLKNKSRRRHYSYYYDSELIEKVRKKFSYEIKIGNYQFENTD